MKKISAIIAAMGASLAFGAAPTQAQSSDAAFLQCMMDCQSWQDPAIRVQCENWCYVVHNPN